MQMGASGEKGVVARPWSVSPRGWELLEGRHRLLLFACPTPAVELIFAENYRYSYCGKFLNPGSQKTSDLYPLNKRKQSVCCQFNINADGALHEKIVSLKKISYYRIVHAPCGIFRNIGDCFKKL